MLTIVCDDTHMEKKKGRENHSRKGRKAEDGLCILDLQAIAFRLHWTMEDSLKSPLLDIVLNNYQMKV